TGELDVCIGETSAEVRLSEEPRGNSGVHGNWTFREHDRAVHVTLDRAHATVRRIDFMIHLRTPHIPRLQPLWFDGAGNPDRRLRSRPARSRLHVDGDDELGIAHATFPPEHRAVAGREQEPRRAWRTAFRDAIRIPRQDGAPEAGFVSRRWRWGFTVVA